MISYNLPVVSQEIGHFLYHTPHGTLYQECIPSTGIILVTCHSEYSRAAVI
jgi:hypothetical protein